MEDNVPQMDANQMAGYSPPAPHQVSHSARKAALPPASANSTSWRPPTHTAETYQPPSITENTTRLLDKEDPKTR